MRYRCRDLCKPLCALLWMVAYATLGVEKWLRNFAQGDKWNFCLTAGTLVPANQERP